MSESQRTTLLLILDGWGYSEQKEHNAILAAHTPTWDRLWQKHPHMLINGSGIDVGLPEGQMGNSEVGHMNIGAGRVIYQDYTRISQAIADGTFANNKGFVNGLEQAKANNKAVHVLGLLSPGGVHSHEQHILAILDLAAKQGIKKLYFHAFLDGRDTPPKSALASIEKISQRLQQNGVGRFASIIGRYYAMDRDKRWQRIEKAYDLITTGKAEYTAASAMVALQAAYDRGETDEFVQATTIKNAEQENVTMEDGDVVIFMNFRADRARELSYALTQENFCGFIRDYHPKLAQLITLTQYADDLKATIAFPPEVIKESLAECVANAGLKQLRVAETEKYAHVTFFMNVGQEQAFPGEERILVPSPKVATYDLKPEMSAAEVTNKLIEGIKSEKYALIICNFANPDMVGHTGDFAATKKAIETIDNCLNRIITALDEVQGDAIITADHGNAEKMYNQQTKQQHTAHTSEPVPLVYFGRPAVMVATTGALCDIAPTILYLLGLDEPKSMTGKVLLELQ